MSDRPLKLGVLGLGRAFTLMLPTFVQDPRIRIVAGLDPRASARALFQSDFKAPAHEHLQDLCQDPEVEVAYVASPHQFHAQQVEALAAAGKHILIEKPLALSMQECDRIIEAVRKNNVSLVVGHSHSFDTPVRHARALLREGSLGPVRMIHAYNYTDFLYRPRRPEELDTGQGGGVVFSQAAHQVDIVRLLGGGLVESVTACTGSWDPQRPTEGAYTAILRFQDAAFASLSYSGYGHFDSDELFGGIGELGVRKTPDQYGRARRRLAQSAAMPESELKASANYGGAAFNTTPAQNPEYHQHFGHVVVSTPRADVRLRPDGLLLYTDERQRFIPLAVGPVPRAEVIDELHDAIRGGAAITHDAAWGKATLEVCLAILESARTGQTQTLRHQVPAP